MKIFTIETFHDDNTRLWVVVASDQAQAEMLVNEQSYPHETIVWVEEVTTDYARVVTKSELS